MRLLFINSPLCLAFFAMLVIAVAGGAVVWNRGYTARVSEAVLMVSNVQNDIKLARKGCHQPDIDVLKKTGGCQVLEGRKDIPVRYLSFGDSFSNTLLPALENISQKYNINGIQTSYSSCPPVFGIDRYGSLQGSYRYKCREFNDAIKDIIAKKNIRDVILYARWIAYTRQYVVGDSPNGPPKSMKVSAEIFSKKFLETMAYFNANGIRVWIVTQQPEYDMDVPRVLARAAFLSSRETLKGMMWGEYEKQQTVVHSLMQEASRRFPNISLIDTSKILCPDRAACLIEKDGKPLYRDSNHLSNYGVEYISSLFDEPFQIISERYEKHH